MSRRTLVITDRSASLAEARQTLCAGGYELQVYEDPVAGVQAAVDGRFELILVSQATAEFDALEIVRQLHTIRPAPPVVILSQAPTVEAAVAAIREGAADYVATPQAPAEWQTLLTRVGQAAPAPQRENVASVGPEGTWAFEGMIGRCPGMREVFDLIRRIAAAEATVLVTGESGTGKELAARAIHAHSRRRDRALLACDCTALAPTLLESELFGHVKGSFSGAIATKKGLFEVAHQGTLLLDEVSNLSMETQGKLLRVLETRQVRKVGDTAEHPVDIRLIAMTNRNLGEMVKVGAFRADLYYRLNVVPIALPALRDRPGDLPLLANAFLDRFSRHMDLATKGFSEEALHQMQVYRWPGNVRELRNIVERLAVLYGGSRIESPHLPMEIREAQATLSAVEVPQTWEELKRLKRQLADDLERRFLIAALDRAGQNVTQAAETAKMQRTNFHALLRGHGLRHDQQKSAE